MVAVFALRLAAGMLACLLILPRRQVHPRYYRTHFLTALGLACLAGAFGWTGASPAGRALLGAGIALAFAGSVVWSLEGAPAGLLVAVLNVAALGGALWLLDPAVPANRPPAEGETESAVAVAAEPAAGAAAANIASAALLGAALSAMLMGHYYLIAPGMSLSPLMRLIGAVAVAVVLRGAVDGWALWRWTAGHPYARLGNDLLLWLPLRWLAGFVLALGLIWMAWQSARIRSTQSATGILYVVVIFCFLGELTDQLLRESGVTF
jgi:hypothetical protein